MGRLRYFIFDLDGTLIDSTEAIIAALQGMEQELGLARLSVETLRAFLGPPLRQSLSEHYCVPPAEVGPLEESYRRCYMEAGVGKTVIFDGVYAALRHIRARGGYVGIATLKQHALAAEVLRVTPLGALVNYAALNTGSGVGDKAQLIRECLKKLGCEDLSEAVMLGDSPYDGRAAAEVGIAFIPLAYGAGFEKAGGLEGLEHLYVAHSPLEMRNFIFDAI